MSKYDSRVPKFLEAKIVIAKIYPMYLLGYKLSAEYLMEDNIILSLSCYHDDLPLLIRASDKSTDKTIYQGVLSEVWHLLPSKLQEELIFHRDLFI